MREWCALAALTLPVLLIAMDNTVLGFAVPALSEALRPSSAELLWIIDIYSFVLAGLLVIMGTLGDRIGRRRLLLLGSAGFGAASVLAAASTSAPMLIGARALLGIAGATLMPSTLSLIRNIFLVDRQRTFAIAVWSVAFAVGSAIGPAVGGWLLASFWWGSVFLIPVPVTVLLLGVVPMLVPESRDPHPGAWDTTGAVLSMAAILPFVFGTKLLAERGPSVLGIGALAVGVLFGARFVRRQRRLADPMIDLRLFHRVGFRTAVVANVTACFAWAGSLFFLTQYLQLVLDVSAARAALLLLPGLGASVLCTLVAGTLARRTSVAAVLGGGLLVTAVGFVILAAAPTRGSEAVAMVAFVFIGSGLGASMPIAVDAVVANVPPERAGAGASVSETGNELGIAMGTALLGTLALAVYRRRLSASAPRGVSPGDLHAAQETLGAAANTAHGLAGDVGPALMDAARTAFTDGMHVSAAVGAAALLAVGVQTYRALRPRRAAGPPPDVAHQADTAGRVDDVAADALAPARAQLLGGPSEP